ncbi:GNAT family N-acetyltransferase [Actinoplanes sp. GCM10030250]|uniref:GNAT family N-acetyltransferase n=1 Tax=Actinoplanes sp. GCM10030250 TaxID=3273376 RepID=UPI00360D1334
MAAAYYEAIALLCRITPKGWYAERGTACATVTGCAVASLNCACTTTLDPDLGVLDEMASEVGRLGVPWSIMVRGEAGDETTALAVRHGRVRRLDMPLMDCGPDEVRYRPVPARAASLRQVGGTESDLYTAGLTECFGAAEGVFGSLMRGAVLAAPEITGYVAEEAGRVVATGLGMRTSGVVGVFNIGVAPAARGRGLGRAITERVMLDGFEAGADRAYLHASSMGRPLYESMNFRLLETWTLFTAEPLR